MPKFVEFCEYDTHKYYYLNVDAIACVQEESDHTARIGLLSIQSGYRSSLGDVLHTSESYRQVKEMISNAEM